MPAILLLRSSSHLTFYRKRINLDVQFGESLRKLGITRVCCDKSRFGQVMSVIYFPVAKNCF